MILKWLFGLEYLLPLKSSYSSLEKLTEMEELQEVQVCSTNKKDIALMMGSLDPISITACTTYPFGHLLHALH